MMNFNQLWSGKRGRSRGNRGCGRGWRGGPNQHYRGSPQFHRGGPVLNSSTLYYGPNRFRGPPENFTHLYSHLPMNLNDQPWQLRNRQFSPSPRPAYFPAARVEPPQLPSRSASPLPGTEEYMQRNISEKSAFLKRELELEGSSFNDGSLNSDALDTDFQTDGTNNNFRENTYQNNDGDDKLDDENKPAQVSNESIQSPRRNNNKRQRQMSQRSLSVDEIHEKIINHISNLSRSKKINLVNLSGPSGYDLAIQEITRQKRAELSKALRDMCNNKFKETDDSSQLINSIIPDFDIKIEELPRELVQQLSSTLNENVTDRINMCIDPELMFQQAAEMLNTTMDVDQKDNSENEKIDFSFMKFSKEDHGEADNLAAQNNEEFEANVMTETMKETSINFQNSENFQSDQIDFSFQSMDFNIPPPVNYMTPESCPPLPPDFPEMQNCDIADPPDFPEMQNCGIAVPPDYSEMQNCGIAVPPVFPEMENCDTANTCTPPITSKDEADIYSPGHESSNCSSHGNTDLIPNLDLKHPSVDLMDIPEPADILLPPPKSNKDTIPYEATDVTTEEAELTACLAQTDLDVLDLNCRDKISFNLNKQTLLKISNNEFDDDSGAGGLVKDEQTESQPEQIIESEEKPKEIVEKGKEPTEHVNCEVQNKSKDSPAAEKNTEKNKEKFSGSREKKSKTPPKTKDETKKHSESTSSKKKEKEKHGESSKTRVTETKEKKTKSKVSEEETAKKNHSKDKKNKAAEVDDEKRRPDKKQEEKRSRYRHDKEESLRKSVEKDEYDRSERRQQSWDKYIVTDTSKAYLNEDDLIERRKQDKRQEDKKFKGKYDEEYYRSDNYGSKYKYEVYQQAYEEGYRKKYRDSPVLDEDKHRLPDRDKSFERYRDLESDPYHYSKYPLDLEDARTAKRYYQEKSTYRPEYEYPYGKYEYPPSEYYPRPETSYPPEDYEQKVHYSKSHKSKYKKHSKKHKRHRDHSSESNASSSGSEKNSTTSSNYKNAKQPSKHSDINDSSEEGITKYPKTSLRERIEVLCDIKLGSVKSEPLSPKIREATAPERSKSTDRSDTRAPVDKCSKRTKRNVSVMPKIAATPEVAVRPEIPVRPEVAITPEFAARAEVAAIPEAAAGPVVAARLEVAEVQEAAAIPEVAAIPDVVAHQDVAAIPDVAAQQDAVAIPDMAEQPDVAAIPDVAAQPDVAAIPDVAAQLDVAAIPNVAAQPEAAAMPDVAAQPEAAAMPDVAAQPEAAAMPNVDERPHVAVMPEVAVSPRARVAASPKVVARPEAAVMPEVPVSLEIEAVDCAVQPTLKNANHEIPPKNSDPSSEKLIIDESRLFVDNIQTRDKSESEEDLKNMTDAELHESKKYHQRPWKSPGEKKFMMEHLSQNSTQGEDELTYKTDFDDKRAEEGTSSGGTGNVDKNNHELPNCPMIVVQAEVAAEQESHASVTVPELLTTDSQPSGECMETNPILHSTEVSSTSDSQKLAHLASLIETKTPLITKKETPVVEEKAVVAKDSKISREETKKVVKMSVTTYTQTSSENKSYPHKKSRKDDSRDRSRSDPYKDKSKSKNYASCSTQTTVKNSTSGTQTHSGKLDTKYKATQTNHVIIMDNPSEPGMVDDTSSRSERCQHSIERMFEIDREIEKLIKLRQSFYHRLKFDDGDFDPVEVAKKTGVTTLIPDIPMKSSTHTPEPSIEFNSGSTPEHSKIAPSTPERSNVSKSRTQAHKDRSRRGRDTKSETPKPSEISKIHSKRGGGAQKNHEAEKKECSVVDEGRSSSVQSNVDMGEVVLKEGKPRRGRSKKIEGTKPVLEKESIEKSKSQSSKKPQSKEEAPEVAAKKEVPPIKVGAKEKIETSRKRNARKDDNVKGVEVDLPPVKRQKKLDAEKHVEESTSTKQLETQVNKTPEEDRQGSKIEAEKESEVGSRHKNDMEAEKIVEVDPILKKRPKKSETGKRLDVEMEKKNKKVLNNIDVEPALTKRQRKSEADVEKPVEVPPHSTKRQKKSATLKNIEPEGEAKQTKSEPDSDSKKHLDLEPVLTKRQRKLEAEVEKTVEVVPPVLTKRQKKSLTGKNLEMEAKQTKLETEPETEKKLDLDPTLAKRQRKLEAEVEKTVEANPPVHAKRQKKSINLETEEGAKQTKLETAEPEQETERNSNLKTPTLTKGQRKSEVEVEKTVEDPPILTKRHDKLEELSEVEAIDSSAEEDLTKCPKTPDIEFDYSEVKETKTPVQEETGTVEDEEKVSASCKSRKREKKREGAKELQLETKPFEDNIENNEEPIINEEDNNGITSPVQSMCMEENSKLNGDMSTAVSEETQEKNDLAALKITLPIIHSPESKFSKKKKRRLSGVMSEYKRKKKKAKKSKKKAALIQKHFSIESSVKIARFSLEQLEEMRESIRKSQEARQSLMELDEPTEAETPTVISDNIVSETRTSVEEQTDEATHGDDLPDLPYSNMDDSASHNAVVIVNDDSDVCEFDGFAIHFKNFTGAILVIKVLGDTVLAASDKGKILCFDILNGELIDTIGVSDLAVTSLVLANRNDTNVLYAGSLDSRLSILNFDTKEILKQETLSEPVQCMEYCWNFIFIGSDRGSLIRFDLGTEKVVDELKISSFNILMMKASQEGPRKVLVVATRNSPVCVRDALSGLLLRTMQTSFSPTVYTLLIDKNLVYCGTSQHDILVYTFEDGQLVLQHEATKSKGVVCMQIVGNLLFAGCYNGNIYVYDTKTNLHLGTMNGPGGLMLSMEIIDDKIIVGTKSSNFKAWKVPQLYLNHM